MQRAGRWRHWSTAWRGSRLSASQATCRRARRWPSRASRRPGTDWTPSCSTVNASSSGARAGRCCVELAGEVAGELGCEGELAGSRTDSRTGLRGRSPTARPRCARHAGIARPPGRRDGSARLDSPGRANTGNADRVDRGSGDRGSVTSSLPRAIRPRSSSARPLQPRRPGSTSSRSATTSSLDLRHGHSPFAWSVLARSPRDRAPRAGDRGHLPDDPLPPGDRRPGRGDDRAPHRRPVHARGRRGRALNEHVVAAAGPRSERHELFREALEIIRRLWSGGYQSYEGKHLKLEDARIFDLPESPIPIAVAIGGPRGREDRRGARRRDLLHRSGFRGLVDAYERAGGSGAKYAEVPLASAPDARGRRTIGPLAVPVWAPELEGARRAAQPGELRGGGRFIEVDDVREVFACGPDADRHLEVARGIAPKPASTTSPWSTRGPIPTASSSSSRPSSPSRCASWASPDPPSRARFRTRSRFARSDICPAIRAPQPPGAE